MRFLKAMPQPAIEAVERLSSADFVSGIHLEIPT